MNLRRLIRSPRGRAQAASAEFRGRARWRASVHSQIKSSQLLDRKAKSTKQITVISGRQREWPGRARAVVTGRGVMQTVPRDESARRQSRVDRPAHKLEAGKQADALLQRHFRG
jgi:hypothetical protein